ncbi:MAG: (Fe-S)-binding protein [Helicobacter sp.]|nr:(Fe-S)-binding protein [Helicobacter sp.]MDY5740372.1 (Fe-S)-binding protein [Helicobacter sp.]
MHLLDLKKLADSCVKCGKCIPSCTIYQVNRDETTSPRGFLDLLSAYKQGDLELDSNAKQIFESCFLCTTCVSMCPASLPTDLAIESVRVEIAKEYGISWYKRAYFFLLRHRKIADFVFSFVAFVAPCAFKSSSYKGEKIKLRARFFLPSFSGLKNRSIFPFVKKSFLQLYGESEFIARQESTQKRVAIFIGCISNYNYINVGKSLLKILDKLEIAYFVPKFQECCGAPAFFTGDIQTVLHLVKKNIVYFESFWDEIDALLIPEATCAAMLKVDWKHALELSGEQEWAQRLEKLLSKVFMASHWLEGNTNLREHLRDEVQDKLVTYHDPCHARKVLGIYKEPRKLLGKNFRLVEMEDSSRCCGFGGISMQASNYELTLKAGIPKAQDIDSTHAQIVSAECGACRMQITNTLDSIKSNVNFIHPLELIAENLK